MLSRTVTTRGVAAGLLAALTLPFLAASPAADAQAPDPLPPDAPNEVVALVSTTDGPRLRVFETSDRAATEALLAELAAAPEVIAANPNWRYQLGAVPPAPSGLTATPSDGSVNLTWDEVASASAYTVYMGDTPGADKPVGTIAPAEDCDSGTCSTSVVGLDNGTSYDFAVSATDPDDGEGLASAPVSATPADTTAPKTPSGVEVTPGDEQFTVTWDPPSDVDVEKVGITVATDAGEVIATLAISAHDGSQWVTQYTYSGLLVNGRTYEVTLSFTDDDGNRSVNTAPFEVVPTGTTGGVPGAPTAPAAVTVDPTDAGLEVSWDPPLEPDVATVYVVARDDAGYVVTSKELTAYSSGSGWATEAVLFDKLVEGRTYTVEVSFADETGRTSAVTAKTVEYTVDLDDAPTGIEATPGDGQITVSWDPPSDGAQVRIYLDGVEAAVVEDAADGSETVVNLDNGTTYQVTVAFVRDGTESTLSAPIAVTPTAAADDDTDTLTPPDSLTTLVPELASCDLTPVRQGTDDVIAYLDSAAPSDDTTAIGNGHTWMYRGRYGAAAACMLDDGETLVMAVTGVNLLREFDTRRTWWFAFQSPFAGEPLETVETRDDPYRATPLGTNRPSTPGLYVTVDEAAEADVAVDGGALDSAAGTAHWGRFTVNELEFDADSGVVEQLSVSFEDHAGAPDAAPLTGELRLNADDKFDPHVNASDPYRTAQWALESLQAEQVWRQVDQAAELGCPAPTFATDTTPARLSADSRCKVIAVIDSGVDATNQDLAGYVLPGWVADTHGSVTPEPVPTDPNGHGTRVASIITAAVDNGYGMAGLARWSRILPIRLTVPTDASLASAILTAVDHDVDVINLSVGTVGPDTELRGSEWVLKAAVDYAVSRGVVVVAAAGNNGADCDDDASDADRRSANGCGNAVVYPAALDGVVSVAATDRRNDPAPFSAHNPFVDLGAPGVDVVTLASVEGGLTVTVPGGDGGDTDDGGDTATDTVTDPPGLRTTSVSSADGTSFAAPYVSASAALALLWWEELAASPVQLSPWSLDAHLRSTALDVGDTGRDDATGAGLVQPLAALTTEPTVESDVPGTPTLVVPDDGIVKEADSDDGTVVTFDVDVVRDGETDPADDLTALCAPQSGEQFPVGDTDVTCQAYDPTTGRTGFAMFTVTVTAADGGAKDGDGDGTPDSADGDAGAGAETPVPNVVNAGGPPPSPSPWLPATAVAALAAVAAARLRNDRSRL